ncbi:MULTISPECIES: hypothetical protein [Salmonella]|uniref:hypothetical protein n=1 Tax=Salmonella TaxID=590 RepID=UPI00397FB903
MNLNEIRHVVITVAKSRIDDYLLNPPYWELHTLSSNTPNVDDILEDIFCMKEIKKLISKEYPQKDFNGKVDRRYHYVAERSGLNTWYWKVIKSISGDNSMTSYAVNSGNFTVDFVVTDNKDNVRVACFKTEAA